MNETILILQYSIYYTIKKNTFSICIHDLCIKLYKICSYNSLIKYLIFCVNHISLCVLKLHNDIWNRNGKLSTAKLVNGYHQGEK